MIVNRLSCCGIVEINGIAIYGDDPKRLLAALAMNPNTPIINRCGWVLFSQAWVQCGPPKTYGIKFKEFLESSKLGMVVQLESTLNRNSGNMIDVFLWKVDHEALQKWYDENMPIYIPYMPPPPTIADAFGVVGNSATAANLYACALNPNP